MFRRPTEALTDRQPRPAAKPKSAPKAAPAASPKVDAIVDNLRRRAGKPSTLKALASTIKAHFRGTAMTDAAVDAIVEVLKARGLIAVKDGKVAYQLG